jgi:hypothetical protein
MTLPFRRRHHDNDASHDRARALISEELDGPLDDRASAWLAGHLERCPDCQREREAYAADRALLRSLRDAPPEPPRDLWARTAAAIDEAAATRRPAGSSPLAGVLGPRGPRGVPFGPLAGVLVAAIVLVFALRPAGIPPVSTPTGSPGNVAFGSRPPAGATPIPLAADRVAWVQSNGSGQFSIVFADVDQACPEQSTGCADLVPSSPAPLDLSAAPKAVVLSPHQDAVAVIGADGEAAGSILMVSVPTPQPTGSPSPLMTPSATFRASLLPSLPVESPAGSALASASSAPAGTGHAIIRGVIVVGRPAYSADGQWFAFSARPAVGGRGPDLYAWHVGDDQATRLTDNGATFFAGWYQDEIVASGVLLPTITADGSSPAPDGAAASPAAGSPEASSAAGPVASPVLLEVHPFSFLLDPSTGTRTEFSRPDVWLPAIDPSGRFVTYWSGTVSPEPPVDGPVPYGSITAWRPATGNLVLDGWSAPLAPVLASGEPGSPVPGSSTADASPSAAPASAAPSDPSKTPGGASPEASAPAIAIGPAGTPIVLSAGPVADFDAQFDPHGTRLAVWTADPADPKVGQLRLVLLDPSAGGIDATLPPLPPTVALRGFSIEDGRLGWVTPPGQDGEPSTVQILAWLGNEFGKVKTVTGEHPQIVR